MHSLIKIFLIALAVLSIPPDVSAQLLRVGVVGLSHDHAHSIMNQYKRGEVRITGIVEPDVKLIERYKKQYGVADSLFYPTIAVMLERTKPEAVLAYNAINEHRAVVEACAPRGIHVMVEKPLATTVEDANKIAALAKQHSIHVLTNYETTWYASNQHLFDLVNNKKSIGPVRKMVVHDGHGGPKEIGCSAEFLSWLTDPVKNGGGALTDFGCYGANLMTWLMGGKTPIAVTAITKQIKPQIYPNVDDEATILIEYKDATGIVEASWNWPFGIKDFEVFGTEGYLHALNGNTMVHRKGDTTSPVSLDVPAYSDNLVYLAAVLRGKVKPENDLSSLSNNLIVVKILDAARRSAKEKKRIEL